MNIGNNTYKIYAEVLEDEALAQFKDAMQQPFVVKGAMMPDAHKGYSLPIGAVVATKDLVVPAWVGYDIGCGMCAIKLAGVSISDIKSNAKEIFDEIYKTIPVGFNVNTEENIVSLEGLTSKGKEIAETKKYAKAICSLGGGNHFIEIGYDESSHIWIIIHSGSRGVGYGIAAHYMTAASSNTKILKEEFAKANKALKKYNPSEYSSYEARYIAKKQGKLRPKEGHYGLHVETELGKDYIQDMNWCLSFALENRRLMLVRVISAISKCTGKHISRYSGVINRNHNHVEKRGELWIHRKGATQAEKGMLGVIPGNMRDGSFIVRGKGNPDSLYSSSHGAGRVLGRREAKRVLNTEEFKTSMQGITALVGEDTLDESPLAYKDIFSVMQQQKDLVDVLYHIKPLVNIKG